MIVDTKDAKSERCKRIKRILLVEDNEINLEIMKSQLTYLGYIVDTALNGKTALLKYQKKQYDLVVTDIEMPEMDGYALLEEIRELEDSAEESTPVFAITASEFDLTAERAKSVGFDGFMLKPLEVETFERRLADLGCDMPRVSTKPQ